MSEDSILNFISYCKNNLRGYEKGEAHLFLDHFFMALDYKDGLKGAGADLEYQVRDTRKQTTSFADLLWPNRVLIEMKKGGEPLDIHLQQVTSYWLKLAGKRPRYVLLCNFDEFWIYDFEKDISEPADKIRLENIWIQKQSFSFLLPKPQEPIFGINRETLTQRVTHYIGQFVKNLTKRTGKEIAIKYCMQCVLSMFADSIGLLPNNIFQRIIKDCLDEPGSGSDPCIKSYDLIGSLFKEMNTIGITKGGRFKGVDYFNGGLFKDITNIELTKWEVELLDLVSEKDWSKINPAIFGSLFEAGFDIDERHILGAHYTYEIDIKKIVDPVIIQPWKKAIERSNNSKCPLDEYYKLLDKLRGYKVLDPACGSGNFLFVAYREMKIIERELILLIKEASFDEEDKKRFQTYISVTPYVSIKQFYGYDVKKYAVEVAKMTLMVAKELWIKEYGKGQINERALPLDNLDLNIVNADALLDENFKQREWPIVDVIIGNPPFQSKRNMQKEYGANYVNRLRVAYQDVPGRADYCVYWFYKAHNSLPSGGRAGLVGTNTIRENYSREGSLDYIQGHGGEIYNAVSSEDWSGESAVDVSIVNWKKGIFTGQKYLYIQNTKKVLEIHKVDHINSDLSLGTDVTKANILQCNRIPKMVFQGQIPGLDGFFVTYNEGRKLLIKKPYYAEVLKPQLIGEELIGGLGSQPKRFLIDFTGIDKNKASTYRELFNLLEKNVLPFRTKDKEIQEEENKKILERNPEAKVNKHHIGFFEHWWQLAYGREDMLKKMNTINRYIATSGVSQRNIFEFVSTKIVPNAAIFAFMFEDDYSFGIIQSSLHWEWWKARCSTLEARVRYTPNSVWDTFPWPQSPTEKQVKEISSMARNLRETRTKALKDYGNSLRDLYRILETPGKNRIKELHENLDKLVLGAYGFDKNKDILGQLLNLNIHIYQSVKNKNEVQSPGLPKFINDKREFISYDCIEFVI